MTVLLLLTLPWVAVLAYLRVAARVPSELPSPSSVEVSACPSVSVIVPARNEAANIEQCVRSLVSSSYPTFEVIVVNDDSDDQTGDIARSLASATARQVRVLEGASVPAGWLGKPWACWQGFAAAEGELLLFTDADTTHGPELLGRAVSGLVEGRSDLLTVMGRQLMMTFWERLVQPQIFLVIRFRFPHFERAARSESWRSAIANGQFLLFRRDAYASIGGHEAVRDEVVEDLALAQRVKRAGLRLSIRSAERDLATRMYRSLGGLVDGWSKNILAGGLRTVPPWVRPFTPPIALLVGVGLWLAPPVALLLALVGVCGHGTLLWSVVVCALSVLLWTGFSREMGVPAAYGLLYPVGALVGTYIFCRSWVRGRRVEWRGRRYELPPLSRRP